MNAFRKSEGFRLLEERGAIRATAHFSGGGDEGDVEEVLIYLPAAVEGGEETVIELAYGWEDWSDDLPDTTKLAVCIVTPIDDRYGSFAGDFSCYGDVVWDVATHTVVLTGAETQYVDFAEEV